MSVPKPDFPKWFRDRGYLHLTGKQNTRGTDAKKLLEKIQENKDNHIARHAFLPLIHTSITERRYKRLAPEQPDRAHASFKNGRIKHHAKSRPLHYASHRDALIFGYYSEILQQRYEAIITAEPELDAAIIGYRKVKSGKVKLNGKPIHKSTAHFASEVFKEIEQRSAEGSCTVLKFDIEKYFSSMSHKRLLQAWAELFGWEDRKLEPDHYNVFKAATRMHYVLLDDLREYQARKGRSAGFNERHLSRIRSQGTEAFYPSVQELRRAIRTGDITVYKAPFTTRLNVESNNGKKWVAKGIPQGLPISATLANIYLMAFDKVIVETLVKGKDCYYRRYSDDLIVICKTDEAEEVKSFVLQTIKESDVEISKEKTEEFWFRQWPANRHSQRLTSIRKGSNFKSTIGHPFTFLGFEFYGYQTLIKSANLAKFYRRMIYAVKRKSKRALKIAGIIENRPILFHNQLYRLYTTKDLRKTEIRRNRKWLNYDAKKEVYYYEVKPSRPQALRSNYLTYVRRAAQILGDKKIGRQVKSHKAIYQQAVKRHFTDKIENS